MKRIIRHCLTALSVVAAAFSASFCTTSSPGICSPVIGDDGAITFNYYAPDADSVSVDVQFAGTHPMTKGKDGVWSLTLGPAVPDIYPYRFIVNGNSVMDPLNVEYFPNEGFKNSLLDMPGRDGGLIHELRDVPHGSVDYVRYWSSSLSLFNNAIVYTPPLYDANPGKSYPVMYLISGTTDTEEVYYKVGRMNLIMDNLLAEGAAKEMIIVLPYGNPAALYPKGTRLPMRMDYFGKDLLDDLMPYVESHYRTIPDAPHRAIGGFSRGGNQALATGLMNLERFSWLCSYSSFTMTTLPEVYDKAEQTNSRINLFWLGVGTDDFLYGNALEYMDFLDSKGIRNMKVFTDDKFGHTWMNARYFLDRSLRLLFQDDPYSMDRSETTDKLPSSGQMFTSEVSRRLFPTGVISPQFEEGGSVTFRYIAPGAKAVSLEGDLSSSALTMTKDDKGVWSVKVPTDGLDGTYKYNFNVDGIKVADPQNVAIAPGEGFKSSLVEIWKDSPLDAKVPNGKMAFRYYRSSVTGKDNLVCIYTPTGYDPNGSESLPVVYLSHKKGDVPDSWLKCGHVNLLMDKLISEGKAPRMILVMPYVPSSKMESSIRRDLVPFMAENYKVEEGPFNLIRGLDCTDHSLFMKKIEAAFK